MTRETPSSDGPRRPLDREAGLARLGAILDEITRPEAGGLPDPEPHLVDPGEVGEFAYAWFTQGAARATATFADVVDHLGLSAADTTVTSFAVPGAAAHPPRAADGPPPARDADLPWDSGLPPTPLSAPTFAHAPPVAAWGAALGSSLRAAPIPPGREMTSALEDVIRRAREACPACAEIMQGTFDMALEEGDYLHASHREEPRAPLRPFEIGASRLVLVPGDLASSRADVLVSSDDDQLSMGGGVSRALLVASGHRLAEEADRALEMARPAVGDVVVTDAPGLDARFIFHAITLRTVGRRLEPVLVDGRPGAVTRQCVDRAFDLVEALHVRSIGFPVIGAGAARVPYADAIFEMADAIVTRLLSVRRRVEVEVFLHDRRGTRTGIDLAREFAERVARRQELVLVPEGDAIRVRTRVEFEHAEAPLATAPAPRPATARPSVTPVALSEGRRRQALARLLLHLDARRAATERDHLAAFTGEGQADPDSLARLTRRLATLRERRAAIEEMLGSGNPPASDSRAVFVSSTRSDLGDHRRAVREALVGRGFEIVGLEAGAATARDATLSYLPRFGTYVVIVGWRYGSLDEATGLSYAELEYVHAVGLGKPVAAFLMDEDTPIRPADLDRDPRDYERLLAFRKLLAENHDATTFGSADDLARKVGASLQALRV